MSGCHPRLVQEWLHAQAVSGYSEHDSAAGRFWLSEEQAACLADETSPAFVAPNMNLMHTLHLDEGRARAAFTGGAPLGWGEHHSELFATMAQTSIVDYEALVPGWLPALDGIDEKLRSGARVADVGCGYGGATILMARAYPASTFHGYDFHADSIEVARKAAAEADVSDRVTFEVAMGSSFPGNDYDLVCTLEALHDMGDPVEVARRIRGALATDGTWMIVEFNVGDRLEDNVNPFGRLLYSAGSFICVPNALSHGSGEALGAGPGEVELRRVATEAGFTNVRRAAETPFNLVLEARP